MKKLYYLLLIFAIILSLCACDKNDVKNLNQIGNTINTDKVEFTLNSVEFTSVIDTSCYLPASEETPSELKGYAPDDRVYACISYSYKNIGKTALKGMSRDNPSGGYMSNISILGYMLDIDYNNGYIFSGPENCSRDIYSIDNMSILSLPWGFDGLEPLTPTKNERCIFSIPKEVVENETAPVNLIVNLPSENKTKIFTYAIR